MQRQRWKVSQRQLEFKQRNSLLKFVLVACIMLVISVVQVSYTKIRRYLENYLCAFVLSTVDNSQKYIAPQRQF